MDLEEVYEAYRAEPLFKKTGLRMKGAKLLRGRGSHMPAVLLVGPAPSALDAAEGRPFAGLQGACLESLMALAGLTPYWLGKQTGLRMPPGCPEAYPPNSFLTHLVKYRADRPPTLAEQLESVKYLRQEWVALGGPKVIIGIGDVVWKNLGPAAIAVSSSIHWSVGQEFLLNRGVGFWPMYHPNYGIKHADMQAKMEEHWERMGKALKEDGVI